MAGKQPTPAKPDKTILAEKPKHKHPGNLGKVMRDTHNSKKMDVLRSYKGK